MGEGKVVDGRRRLLVLFGANPKAKLKALRQRTFSHTQHTTYHQFQICCASLALTYLSLHLLPKSVKLSLWRNMTAIRLMIANN